MRRLLVPGTKTVDVAAWAGAANERPSSVVRQKERRDMGLLEW